MCRRRHVCRDAVDAHVCDLSACDLTSLCVWCRCSSGHSRSPSGSSVSSSSPRSAAFSSHSPRSERQVRGNANVDRLSLSPRVQWEGLFHNQCIKSTAPTNRWTGLACSECVTRRIRAHVSGRCVSSRNGTPIGCHSNQNETGLT